MRWSRRGVQARWNILIGQVRVLDERGYRCGGKYEGEFVTFQCITFRSVNVLTFLISRPVCY